MTMLAERDKAVLARLGWTEVRETFPPLGEEIDVMRVIDRDHQELWRQSFASRTEVKESGITHWAKIVKREI